MARGPDSRDTGEPTPRKSLQDRRDADPRQIVRTLNGHGVEYIAIGGVAALSHGVSRITRDFDILIEPSAANCRRAIEALVTIEAEEFLVGSKQWVPVDPKAAPGWLLKRPRFFDSTAGAIDICNAIPDVPSWEEASKGAEEIEAFAERFKVIDRDTLIRSKLAAGRDKDLQDVTELTELGE